VGKFFKNIFFKRAAVHTDSYRNASFSALIRNGTHSFNRADISGVYPYFVGTALCTF